MNSFVILIIVVYKTGQTKMPKDETKWNVKFRFTMIMIFIKLLKQDAGKKIWNDLILCNSDKFQDIKF